MADGGREPRERGREATTAAILDAAEELFSTRGYTAVSVRAIAERAGISHALVHRYIGRKADIYRAVLKSNQGAILGAAPDNPDILASTSLMLREGWGSIAPIFASWRARRCRACPTTGRPARSPGPNGLSNSPSVQLP